MERMYTKYEYGLHLPLGIGVRGIPEKIVCIVICLNAVKWIFYID